jgi:hypothetical protein
VRSNVQIAPSSFICAKDTGKLFRSYLDDKKEKKGTGKNGLNSYPFPTPWENLKPPPDFRTGGVNATRLRVASCELRGKNNLSQLFVSLLKIFPPYTRNATIVTRNKPSPAFDDGFRKRKIIDILKGSFIICI